ncbi:MFS transporter [Halolamina salifodinae]|uniref:MFS family permease n=1 Tax=Halolamina salifodinae TaxID=1202767 RepID=A0A8T4GV21_9EURY|nr:MFS transporter [Halolamina salifodinae]MBP1986746.1 MFS family permease [Halolamina salifodinae]
MARFGNSVALLRDREFLALAGTAFARSQAYSTIIIALALYADAFGTSGFIEGMWGTAFAVVQLLIVLPLGRKIDTGNAKRWLLGGLVVNVFVFLGYMFVSNSVDVIFVRMLQGIGASMLWITGSTVVGQISPDDESGRWLGSYNQVAAFSSLAGDVVGGLLLTIYDPLQSRVVFAVLTAVTILAFVLVYSNLRDNPGGGVDDPEAQSGVGTVKKLLKLPILRSLVLFRLSFSVGKMAVIIFLPILASTEFGIGAFAIGWILAGGKLTKSLFQGYVGDLTDRIGDRAKFVAAGALVYGIGIALIPLSLPAEEMVGRFYLGYFGHGQELGGGFLVLFGAYAVLGIGDSIRLPASMALFVEEGEKYDSVASAMSLRSISWKIGQTAGPLGVGLIKDFVGTVEAFLTASVFVIFATGVFWLTHTLSKEPEGVDPSLDD